MRKTIVIICLITIPSLLITTPKFPLKTTLPTLRVYVGQFQELSGDTVMAMKAFHCTGQSDWFMKSHVTPAGPIQILPGTSDKNIRKETLGIDQPEDISLEFQELCEKSMPKNDACIEKWASKKIDRLHLSLGSGIA